jgi:TRAP-type C4-dicarboxylate transport system substrate-binding protein
MRRPLAIAIFFAFGTALAQGAPSKPVEIKLATVIPEGSSWHRILQDMGEKWKAAPGGGVKLRIFAGGIAGDEPDAVAKLRIGQFQAAALSTEGLSQIDPSLRAFQIPMMFRSYEELDHAREALRPLLEKRLADRGFVVLNWGDGGWVTFFTRDPAPNPAALRPQPIFVWAGDNDEVELYKRAGFRPVPLASNEILPSLQTGLIRAVPTTPLLALASQWFALAPHMTEIRWAPLLGATVVTKRAWEQVPDAAKPFLLDAAREAGERLKAEIRSSNDEAVSRMKERGLKVVTPSAADLAAWEAIAREHWPDIRERIVPADVFDAVRKDVEAFRAGSR